MIDASKNGQKLEEAKKELSVMLRKGEVKLKDIPKHMRDEVAKMAFGRYPMKDFSSLEVIKK